MSDEVEDARAAAMLGRLKEPEKAFGPFRYLTVGDFVENVVFPVYQRQVEDVYDRVWCPSWWMHQEAVSRFTAVWFVWEQAKWDETGAMSAFWLNHLDPHMKVLFDPQGPFKYCSVRAGHKDTLKPLAFEVAPRILYDPNGPRVQNPVDNQVDPDSEESGPTLAPAERDAQS